MCWFDGSACPFTYFVIQASRLKVFWVGFGQIHFKVSGHIFFLGQTFDRFNNIDFLGGIFRKKRMYRGRKQ